MIKETFEQIAADVSHKVIEVVSQTETYLQLACIVGLYVCAYLLSRKIRSYTPMFDTGVPEKTPPPLRKFVGNLGNLIFPLLAILFLSILTDVSDKAFGESWLVEVALTITILLVFSEFISDFVKNQIAANILRWVGLPLLFLHLVGILGQMIVILESMSLTVGNIEISAYGLVRVLIFGSLLFWLGRVSNATGKDIIRRQESLDYRTREVAAKLFEIGVFVVVSLLLLQVMGINLTALAVFSGAVGVGLGFGLQAIASNFISGIIILLDRSISVGDYIELVDGRMGQVTEMSLRSTTLETFDGKVIMVPNEKFIVESFTNWTHKDKKQRYRVDFSVAYDSDIRKLVEIIKQAVSEHPQVLSGEEFPIEERPDCEIDSFGDSGINMFVEFWMYGIDDGKNRVGGDLLLTILECIRENGFAIPFPQREVRVLNSAFSVSGLKPQKD